MELRAAATEESTRVMGPRPERLGRWYVEVLVPLASLPMPGFSDVLPFTDPEADCFRITLPKLGVPGLEPAGLPGEVFSRETFPEFTLPKKELPACRELPLLPVKELREVLSLKEVPSLSP